MFALFLLKHLSHSVMTGNVQIAIFRAPLVMGWSGVGVNC